MPVTRLSNEGHSRPDHQTGDQALSHPPLMEQEPAVERRVRAQFRAAERGGLQWRRRSPNQRSVAHRSGNR
jgi:acyl-CoA reductase-like NAD-dependent aldehyde dehydrogenase